MSPLQVFLFGKFRMLDSERSPVRLDSFRAQELLCYLLLNRGHPQCRERLASQLWGNTATTAESRGQLRKALWYLQSVLDGNAGSADACLLLVEPGWVQINPDSKVWLDVAAFEGAFDLLVDGPSAGLEQHQAESLRSVVEFYQGDLLEGWYQEWCLFERERFQYMYLAMLDRLMVFCEARQRYEAGVDYGKRILRYDRAREHTHRQLMRLYCLAGNRTAALRQYEQCMAALQEELGVGPARRTTALYELIRADRLDRPSPVPARTVRRPTGPLPPETPGRQSNLDTLLCDLQRQLQEAIQTLDLALSGRWLP